MPALSVIPADGTDDVIRGTRPALPYLTVLVRSTGGRQQLVDDRIYRDDGDADLVKESSSGMREASISVQGFGSGSRAWMEEYYSLPGPVCREYEAVGVGINQGPAGVTDLSQLLDTSIEPRYLLEMTSIYGRASAEYDLRAISTVEVDADGETISIDADDPVHCP